MNTFLLKHLDRGGLGAAKVTDLGFLPSMFGFWGRWAAADHVESRSRAKLLGAVMPLLSALEIPRVPSKPDVPPLQPLELEPPRPPSEVDPPSPQQPPGATTVPPPLV